MTHPRRFPDLYHLRPTLPCKVRRHATLGDTFCARTPVERRDAEVWSLEPLAVRPKFFRTHFHLDADRISLLHRSQLSSLPDA